jgi:hypothetical protein
MKSTSRPIFRPEAVRRYTERRERSVLPPLVSTPVMDFLWYFVALLVFAGVAVWLTNIPVYSSGLAIAIDNRNRLTNIQADAALLVLLPPQAQPALAEGKTVLVQVNTSSKPLRQKVITFESDSSQVRDILSRFGLSNHPAVLSVQPAALAFTDLEPMPGKPSLTDYIGSVFRVDIQVGSRQAASLLPLLD